MTIAGNYKPAAVKEDGTLDMQAVQRDWMAIINRHERKRSNWLARCEKIVKIYADAETKITSSVARKYCVLWANIQTRQPAIYSRAPKCVVSRRYQTPDETVRTAVLALERATNIVMTDAKLHESILSARTDRLLAGRGTIWLRYDAKDDGQKITAQNVYSEFVNYKDFGHGEGRVWEEVDCAWRATYYTKDRMTQRFGEDVMTRCGVTLDYAEKDAPDGERQATIYEVWCKSRNATYWLAKTATAALDVGEPPLKLKNFWPFPRPLFATLSNESCLPTPDYIYYQDQAEEITRLTKRIDKLTDQLKLVGFYPAGPSTEGRAEIERALSPQIENKLIPVPSWAAFAEKGGVSQIQYLPVKDIAFIVESCVKLRQQLLNDVDQITGISDIMRGETVASETLGAQQLKSQYGSLRIRDTVQDFIRFAAEACQIIAEIVAEHWVPSTLGQITALTPFQMTQPAPAQVDPQTGQPMASPPPQPTVGPDGLPVPAPWVQLLRNDFAREVLVDVETDSTIQPDEDAEKSRRMEFLGAFTQSMTPLTQLSQLDPATAATLMPLWGDTVLFVVRGFRAGRDLEEQIELTVQQLTQLAQAKAKQAENPPQPPADPRVAIEQAKAQAEGHRAQAEAVKAQAQAQLDGVKAQVDGQAQMHETSVKASSDQANKARDHEHRMAQTGVDHRKLDIENKKLEQTDRHHQESRKDAADRAAAQADQATKAKTASDAGISPDGTDDMRFDIQLPPEIQQMLVTHAVQHKASLAQKQIAAADAQALVPQALMAVAEAMQRGAQATERAAIATEHAAHAMAAPKKLVKDKNGDKMAVPVMAGETL